jgi:CubicO group peptidase (beta-lactamase class C family)
MTNPRGLMAAALAGAMLAFPLFATAQTPSLSAGAAVYYPGTQWESKTPSDAGISETRLKEAIDAAVVGETKASRDLVMNHYQTFGREPFGYAIGPIRERGDPTGVIIYRGYLVAQWGDVSRVDMTHSVTKSMLSSVVGIAFDRGMIRSLDDPVKDYIGPIQVYSPVPVANKSERIGSADLIFPFEGPHNSLITWDHMLRQNERLGRHALGQA